MKLLQSRTTAYNKHLNYPESYKKHDLTPCIKKNDKYKTLYRGIAFGTKDALTEWLKNEVKVYTETKIDIKLNTITSWTENYTLAKRYADGVTSKSNKYGNVILKLENINGDKIFCDLSLNNIKDDEVLLKPGKYTCGYTSSINFYKDIHNEYETEDIYNEIGNENKRDLGEEGMTPGDILGIEDDLNVKFIKNTIMGCVFKANNKYFIISYITTDEAIEIEFVDKLLDLFNVLHLKRDIRENRYLLTEFYSTLKSFNFRTIPTGVLTKVFDKFTFDILLGNEIFKYDTEENEYDLTHIVEDTKDQKIYRYNTNFSNKIIFNKELSKILDYYTKIRKVPFHFTHFKTIYNALKKHGTWDSLIRSLDVKNIDIEKYSKMLEYNFKQLYMINVLNNYEKINDLEIEIDLSEFDIFYIIKEKYERIFVYKVFILLLKHKIGINNNKALVESAKHGYLEIVEYLVGEGADVNYNYDKHYDDDDGDDDDDGAETALRESIKYGHLEIVKFLIWKGAYVYDGYFTLSVMHGHLDIVKFLDKYVGISRYLVCDLVYLMGSDKQLEIAEYLIEQGICNKELLLFHGNLEILKILIKYGKDAHAQEDIILRDSAKNGHLGIVKYLVENGADIHAINDEALRNSAKNGHLGIVKYLVNLGADVHAEENYTLIASAEIGYLEIVKYLLENEYNKADIHAKKDMALRLSAQNGQLKIVKYLVENGADVHAKEDYALIASAQNGHLEIVKYLVENGAVYTGDDQALRTSAQNGHLEIVKYLLENEYNKADIHIKEDSALRLSAKGGYLEIVKYLVGKGANIHAEDDQALRFSAENGHLEVVKYLVENGTDVHAKEDYALRFSTKNGHLEVVKYLKKQL
jgi:ankyrin repeat protein